MGFRTHRYDGLVMVAAYGQTNIAITGGGILDASGTQSWNTGSNRAGIVEPVLEAHAHPEEWIVPHLGRLHAPLIDGTGKEGNQA